MNKRKQELYGRIGGSAKGPTKRRNIDYVALGRLGAKVRAAKKADREKQ